MPALSCVDLLAELTLRPCMNLSSNFRNMFLLNPSTDLDKSAFLLHNNNYNNQVVHLIQLNYFEGH